MAYKYGSGEGGDGGFRNAVIANANRGGENVATGALIGALLGAQSGFSKLPKDLVRGLAGSQQPQLADEIDAFVAAVPFADDRDMATQQQQQH